MLSQSVDYDNNTTTYSEVKSNKGKKRPKSNGCCFIFQGNVAIILGLSLIMLQTTIMSYIAETILNLKSDSSIFHVWQKYPMKVPVAVTFFNWTNHKDFFNKSVKPKFEEIGPYTFLQAMERVNIVKNDNNDTITFKQIRTYEYDNNLSNNGNLSDQLTTINYFTMFVGHSLNDWNDALKDVFSEYIAMFNPYYYFDTIIDDELLKGSNNLLLELSNYFDFIAPEVPRLDGFGWGKLKNGDPNIEGVYNIANGANRQFDVLNWNYKNTTPAYNESCSKIKGTLGDVYSSPLTKEFITIFSAELCRYLKLYFEDEVIIDGIIGYKYSFTKLSLDNGTLNPENKCFCGGPCRPSGLICLSSCWYNLNAYLSLPHYYNADPIYLDPFEGLNPEKEKHESYIIVEPNSLLCMEFKVTVQLNMLIYPVEGISFFDDFPNLYFPLFWVDMHVQLPNDLKKYLKLYLLVPYVIIGFAIILITLGICLIYYGVHKYKQFRSLKRLQYTDQD